MCTFIRSNNLFKLCCTNSPGKTCWGLRLLSYDCEEKSSVKKGCIDKDSAKIICDRLRKRLEEETGCISGKKPPYKLDCRTRKDRGDKTDRRMKSASLGTEPIYSFRDFPKDRKEESIVNIVESDPCVEETVQKKDCVKKPPENSVAEPKGKKTGYLTSACWRRHPHYIFQEWLRDATPKGRRTMPITMTLATACKSGVPSIRTVSIKGYCEQGFIFFTNFCSDKAQELEENPYCALHVWWQALARQVRVVGCAAKFSDSVNATYYNALSHNEQALCHLRQSEPVVYKEQFFKEYTDLVTMYRPPQKIPRTKNWGGYMIRPFMFEFSEFSPDLLHDRVRFRREVMADDGVVDDVTQKGENGWVYEWLTP